MSSRTGAEPGTILVTGGAGFIGSHVVDRLIAAGHRPRIYDLRHSPYHSPRSVEQVRGDIGDADRLASAMEGCDAVIHLAAAADVGEVEAEPGEAERRNARGTLQVLEAARRSGVRRVLYASTVWVYSDTELDLLAETDRLAPPAHLYSATKLAGELYCHAYGSLYGVEHTVLRFGIPYGPRARPAAVVPSFIRQALAGEPLTVAGDGLQSRRFVYVEDLADGVVRALAPEAANRTYNLVSPTDISINEIATTVQELLGDVEIVRVPGRNADFAGAPICGERAAAELGWRPETPFREGVRRAIEWERSRDGAGSRAVAARERILLARRAGVALVFGALLAIIALGVATLVPIDPDLDPYDSFAELLLLLVPLVMALGFDWSAHGHRNVRWLLTAIAAIELSLALVPFPQFLHEMGADHRVALTVAGLTTLAAGIAGASTTLRLRFATE
jgi:UDP-glucose 4-epimerase